MLKNPMVVPVVILVIQACQELKLIPSLVQILNSGHIRGQLLPAVLGRPRLCTSTQIRGITSPASVSSPAAQLGMSSMVRVASLSLAKYAAAATPVARSTVSLWRMGDVLSAGRRYIRTMERRAVQYRIRVAIRLEALLRVMESRAKHRLLHQRVLIRYLRAAVQVRATIHAKNLRVSRRRHPLARKPRPTIHAIR